MFTFGNIFVKVFRPKSVNIVFIVFVPFVYANSWDNWWAYDGISGEFDKYFIYDNQLKKMENILPLIAKANNV